MKLRTVRTAPVVASLAMAALALGACGGGSGAGAAEPGETTTSAAVSANPDAPELTARVGGHNFIRSGDDGRTHMLAHVEVRSADGWIGLQEDEGQFSALDDGKYRVIALDTSTCTVGADAGEGLGSIGEVHVEKGAANVWSTPVKAGADEVAALALADSDGSVVSCGRGISWNPPSSAPESS